MCSVGFSGAYFGMEEAVTCPVVFSMESLQSAYDCWCSIFFDVCAVESAAGLDSEAWNFACTANGIPARILHVVAFMH
jgi:hypothetical protein